MFQKFLNISSLPAVIPMTGLFAPHISSAVSKVIWGDKEVNAGAICWFGSSCSSLREDSGSSDKNECKTGDQGTDDCGHPVWGCRIVWCILTSQYLISLLPVFIIHVSDIFLVGFWSLEKNFYYVGLPGLGLAGGQDLGVGFPWNGGIPRPHRVTWSRPINVQPVKARKRAEKPTGALVWTKARTVCTNRIALSLNKTPRTLCQ